MRGVDPTLLTCCPLSGLRPPCAGAGPAAWWRRGRWDLVLEIVEVVSGISVFRVGWFDPSQGHFLDATAWQMNLDACLSPRVDAEWSLERLGQRRVDAPPTDHDVGRVGEVLWDVDIGDAVRRRLGRLKAFNLEAGVG